MEELACPQKNYFVSGIRRVTPIIPMLPWNCIWGCWHPCEPFVTSPIVGRIAQCSL
jgi:hypothetical protein